MTCSAQARADRDLLVALKAAGDRERAARMQATITKQHAPPTWSAPPVAVFAAEKAAPAPPPTASELARLARDNARAAATARKAALLGNKTTSATAPPAQKVEVDPVTQARAAQASADHDLQVALQAASDRLAVATGPAVLPIRNQTASVWGKIDVREAFDQLRASLQTLPITPVIAPGLNVTPGRAKSATEVKEERLAAEQVNAATTTTPSVISKTATETVVAASPPPMNATRAKSATEVKEERLAAEQVNAATTTTPAIAKKKSATGIKTAKLEAQSNLTARSNNAAVSVVFVKSPFKDLHDYWDDPSKPNQIRGEWLTDNQVKSSNVDENALTGILHQGFYVPTVDGKRKPMKMFTSLEARQCLAGKKVFFAGDSYQEQFFIGLADLLLNQVNDNHELQSKEGKEFASLNRRLKAMAMNQTLHEKHPELSGVLITCMAQPECYGNAWVDGHGNTEKCTPGRSLFHTTGRPTSMHMKTWDMTSHNPPAGCKEKPNPDANSLKICDQCLSNLPTADALVVGSTIHLLNARGNRGELVAEDITWLRRRHKNMIWTAGPHVEVSKITESQQKYFAPVEDPTNPAPPFAYSFVCYDIVMILCSKSSNGVLIVEWLFRR